MILSDKPPSFSNRYKISAINILPFNKKKSYKINQMILSWRVQKVLNLYLQWRSSKGLLLGNLKNKKIIKKRFPVILKWLKSILTFLTKVISLKSSTIYRNAIHLSKDTVWTMKRRAKNNDTLPDLLNFSKISFVVIIAAKSDVFSHRIVITIAPHWPFHVTILISFLQSLQLLF